MLDLLRQTHDTFRVTAAATAIAGVAIASADVPNLAKYQRVTASSELDSNRAAQAVDGVASNLHRWISDSSGAGHWLQIDFAAPARIGTIHLLSGGDGQDPISSLAIEAWDEQIQGWVEIPETRRAGNTLTELVLDLHGPATTTAIRLVSDDNKIRVREIAAYPPGAQVDVPLGSDVRLNIAGLREVWASSVAQSGGGYTYPPMLAVDGFVTTGSEWRSASGAGPHRLELELPSSSIVGGAHLYLGNPDDPSSAPAEFSVEYWDAQSSSWNGFEGGTVEGNSGASARTEIELEFSDTVTTDRVRLSVDGPGNAIVREIVLFPPSPGGIPPLGVGVSDDAPPADTFNGRFGDAYHAIVNAFTGEAVELGELAEETGRKRQQHQILLNIGTDHYRIVNRTTGLALSAEEGSTDAGARVVEAAYSAAPHQQWRVVDDVFGTLLVNRLSGHALQPDGVGGLIQTEAGTDRDQSWQIRRVTHFPKKGLAGWNGFVNKFRAEWLYDWGLGGNSPGQRFVPMKWGNFSWRSHLNKIPAWQRRAGVSAVLGFNEPDVSNQSNMSVATALDLWPRLQDANVPLGSPATANAFNTWMSTYEDSARKRGYRADFTAIHTYPGPSADGLISYIRGAANAYGRPVWLTEFATVDWSNTDGWDQDDNYNFYAEVLWRMEKLPELHRYSIFVFTGGSATRGNMLKGDNSTLTASGHVYAAWDGDTAIRTDTAYYLHNRGKHVRVGSNDEDRFGNEGPRVGNRDTNGEEYQFFLVDAGTEGGSRRYFVQSAETGERLYRDGAKLAFGPVGSSSTAYRWGLAESEHGWFYLNHPSSDARLARDSANTDWEFVPRTNTNGRAQWRLVRPVSHLLGPVSSVSADSVGPEVSVSWSPHGHPSVETYRVALRRFDDRFGEEIETTVGVVLGTSFEFAVDPAFADNAEIVVTAVTEDGDDAIPAAVTLAVCGADLDGSGASDTGDVLLMLDRVEGAEAGADFNGDGGADFFDMLGFLTAHAAGCSP